METIIPGQKKILKLWLPQKKTSEEYRFFKYIVTKEINDGVLMCNTVTGSMVLLSSKEIECLNERDVKYDDLSKTLIENRFLVPKFYDDKKIVKQLRNIMRKLNSTENIVNYNILPTTFCNARCFYCYESDYRHTHMSDQTIEKLVDFIKNHHKGKPIRLSWFGGEPLIGYKCIDSICSMLKKEQIEYSSYMISNGYLFDANLIKHAKEQWMLTKIQITLDGTEKIYNQTKAYVNASSNPYKRVLDNIDKLIQAEIQVDIRLNLDFHNLEDMENLISELQSRFSGKKYVGVYIHSLYEGMGYEPVFHNDDERNYLEKERIRLETFLKECKLSTSNKYILPQLKYFQCMADNPQSVQCSPDGILSKCEHYIYDHVIGDLDSGIDNIESLNFWQEVEEFDECRSCPLMPSCLHVKNCPGNIHTCLLTDKEWKLAFYKENMMNVYNNWKHKKMNIQ